MIDRSSLLPNDLIDDRLQLVIDSGYDRITERHQMSEKNRRNPRLSVNPLFPSQCTSLMPDLKPRSDQG